MRFSGSAGSEGDRPIVVSYATSPPAEVIFRSPRPAAGTDRGRDGQLLPADRARRDPARRARTSKGARELVDFMLSTRFQEDVPLSMFVFPVDPNAAAPARVPRASRPSPRSRSRSRHEQIEANRDRWIKEWTATVLR